jgi:ABC-2 type transport system ATP-binding protein
MSIEIKEISKFYGEQKALDSISFSVKTGEVIGFLGPNGAGKSTLMKILTCFIPPSSGSAKVCGYDVMDDPMEVRRRVGYLPEHNPLYLDMYVKEFLQFVGGMNRVPNLNRRVDEMIELVSLGREQHKQLGALSKGYRQRVGLAQAMIHDPEVLILDEPTSGLDPNQLVEIRSLISAIGQSKTVMLSTHIMQEVEAICNRVVIINRGEIVADDSADRISRYTEGSVGVLHVEFDGAVDVQALLALEGINKVEPAGTHAWRIETSGDGDHRKRLAAWAQANQRLIYTLREEEQKLEDAFKRLTNK